MIRGVRTEIGEKTFEVELRAEGTWYCAAMPELAELLNLRCPPGAFGPSDGFDPAVHEGARILHGTAICPEPRSVPDRDY